MFQSVAWIISVSILTLMLVLFYSVRKNPFFVIFNFMTDLFKKPFLLIHFLSILIILALNKIEISLKSYLPQFLDWTPYIMKLEGNATPILQKMLYNDILTYICTYFYVIVFSILMLASLFIYHHDNNRQALYATFYGVTLNYIFAVPFYMLLPVYEAWTAHPDLTFLIPEVYPNFEVEYRPFSALDNSFPSLHTSLSLTLALIAFRSGNIRFFRITALSAGWVLFGIIYLGIHWLIDMVAGGILAYICVGIAHRLVQFSLKARPIPLRPYRKPTSEHPSSLSS